MVGGKGDALFWYTDAHAKQLIKVTKDSDKASVTYLTFAASAVAPGTNDDLFLAEFGKAIYRVIPDQSSPTRWQAAPVDILFLDPDKNVWTSEGSALAKLSPAEGVKTIDLGNSVATGLCVGPDKALWFTDGFSDQLVRVNFDGSLSGTVNLPTTSSPGRIITGPDKALWFTEGGRLKIGRYDPSAGEPVHYPLPTADARPYALAIGPDNNIWFTEDSRKVGRLIPDPIVP
jgi:virginiamycin B lyase